MYGHPTHISVEDMTDEQWERHIARMERDQDSRNDAYIENADRLVAHE